MNSMLLALNEKDASLYNKFCEVRDKFAAPRLRRIVVDFPHYTCHDDSHSETVLEVCSWLIGRDNIHLLNPHELFVLCCAIYLHDVGMVVESQEKARILSSPEYSDFRSTVSELSDIEAFAEYVRRSHHVRSETIVRSLGESPFGVDLGLANAIGLLCRGHGERELQNHALNDPFYAYGTSGVTLQLPLLGVFLRLSDLLHLTSDRTPLSLIPIVSLQNERSKTEWEKHLSVTGVAPIEPDCCIRLQCVCTNPQIHREVILLCDYVNSEFRYCHEVLRGLEEKACTSIPLRFREIQPHIQPNGYEPWLELKFQLDESGIISLLTGARLYPGPEAVAKELVINAVDATRQRIEDGGENRPIVVELDTSNGELTVTDQGRGMDRTEIENFLLRLGRSFYRSDSYNESVSIEAVSEFGIGFASCFLVSDRVVVETKKMGCDALKLDLYGLLSFAAVQKTSQHQVGTSVRLHLKDEHVEKIRTGLQELDAYCRRIEIDVTVRIDGAETTIRPKPTEFSNSEILKPFFQDRGQELEIQYRRLNAGHDGGVSGAFGLVCHRRGEVLYPGYRSWFALTERLGRNVSQLGFAIPFEQLKLNSLLARLAVTSVFYELDLSGAMRLELDPSRTRVQLSDHNHGIAADLDAKFSEFILDIFEYHWKSLTRQLRFDVFDQLARIVLHHVLDRGQTKIGAKAVSPLIDLFFENTPFEVASIAEKSRMSWNEIRALRKPIVPLYRYQRDSASGFDDIVDEVLQIRPDVVVVVFDGSHRWADKFFWLADTTGVILAEKCKHSLAVYQPWQGNFIELVTRRWEPPHNPWSFIQPFSPSGNCAFVTPNVPPRTAEMSSWVNGSHHKIATMIRLASKFKNEQASRTFNFFQFLQNEGRVGSPQSDFAEYVIEQQRMALNEFREAGAISKADVENLLLHSDELFFWSEL